MKKFNAISPLFLFGTTLFFFFASNHQSAKAEFECPTFGETSFFFSFSKTHVYFSPSLSLSLCLLNRSGAARAARDAMFGRSGRFVRGHVRQSYHAKRC